MRWMWCFIAISLLFGACKARKDVQKSERPETINWSDSKPVQLGPDETTIYLTDHFSRTYRIDRVMAPPGLIASLGPQKQRVGIKVSKASALAPFSLLKIQEEDKQHELLLRKSRKVAHRLTYDMGDNVVQTVSVAGEMNSWNPAATRMERKGRLWEATIMMEPGSYQYQLVVDGEWMLDPANDIKVDNNIGGFNSLMKIGETSDAGEALHLTLSGFDRENVYVHPSGRIGEMYAFCGSMRIRCFKESDGRYRIPIPEESKMQLRSHLRIYAHDGKREYNDVLVPLELGKVMTSTKSITRTDKEAQILYFMMVDRFANGNHGNDEPLKDKKIHRKANYHGGDIAGITQRINDGYFSSLNVNTIWLSPICQNPLKGYVEYPAPHRTYSGYHGYWPISFTKIDHRFGTEREFQSLVNTAHGMQMNVLLDFVSNHVHESHPIIKKHPDWKTNLTLPDGSKNIRIWDEQRLTTWFDTFLPTLDFSKREVIDMVSDSALHWIKKYDLDGFRHDATKHIPEDYWRALTKKLKTEIVYADKSKSLFQIGETFGSRELIGSYVGAGQLDAQFDFNLYFDARTAFASDEAGFGKLGSSLKASLDAYGCHHLMGNITGNHDMPRFISYASGAMKFDEDPKAVGWKRKIKVKKMVGYAKLQSLTAFIMTIPGLPVIYYGDEIGMPGADDPDNRRDMRFTNLSSEEVATFKNASALGKLRSSNMALIYGDLQIHMADGEQMIYSRRFIDDYVMVFFNKSSKSQVLQAEIPAEFAEFQPELFGESEVQAQQQGQLLLEMKPNSFEILTFKR